MKKYKEVYPDYYPWESQEDADRSAASLSPEKYKEIYQHELIKRKEEVCCCCNARKNFELPCWLKVLLFIIAWRCLKGF
jgi:hypothetical protein